ncbi:MAG: aldo/keto reductase [Nitriliruptorales bacterium]
MEYRVLGRTGVRVSSLCLGAMMFGEWGSEDDDTCVRMIHRAIDAGINFIDTADVYSGGRSEEVVGRALADRRDEVVLATKVHGPMGKGPNERGNSRLWIQREVEHSLRRLGTDHIDLYQIHRPDLSMDLEETLGALTDLVREGKVRYLGCSTFPGWHIVESQRVSDRRGLERFVCEQPPYSIFVRHAEREVFPVLERHGMGAIAWSPLAGGWLAGRYRGGEVPEDSRKARFDRPEISEHIRARFDLDLPENQRKLEAVERLVPIAEEAGLSLTHLATAFVRAHPAITSAIIGPRTPEQLDDLLGGADVTLGSDVLDAIDEIVPPGETIAWADRGLDEPWLAPESRRH